MSEGGNTNVEYVIRVVLKARDDMSAVFAKVRAEMESLTDSTNQTDDAVERLGSRVTSLNVRAKSASENLGKLKKATDDLGGSVERFLKAEKELEGVGDRNAQILDRQAGATARKVIVTQEVAAATREATEATKESAEEEHARLLQEVADDRQRAEIDKQAGLRNRRTKEQQRADIAATRGERTKEQIERDTARAKELKDSIALAGLAKRIRKEGDSDNVAKKVEEIYKGLPKDSELRSIFDRIRSINRAATVETDPEKQLDFVQKFDNAVEQLKAHRNELRESIKVSSDYRKTQKDRKETTDALRKSDQQAAAATAAVTAAEVAANDKARKARGDKLKATVASTQATKEETAAEQEAVVQAPAVVAATEEKTAASKKAAEAKDKEAKATEALSKAESLALKRYQIKELTKEEQDSLPTRRGPKTKFQIVDTIGDEPPLPRSGKSKATRDTADLNDDYRASIGLPRVQVGSREQEREKNLERQRVEAARLGAESKQRQADEDKRAADAAKRSADAVTEEAETAERRAREAQAEADSIAEARDLAAMERDEAAGNAPKKPEKLTAAQLAIMERQAARAQEENFDDLVGEPDLSPDEDGLDELGSFGAFGGGAPRKPAIEAAIKKDREALQKKEIDSLRKTKVEYESLSGAYIRYSQLFLKGKLNEEEFIARLKAFEQGLTRIQRKIAGLTTVGETGDKSLAKITRGIKGVREEIDRITGLGSAESILPDLDDDDLKPTAPVADDDISKRRTGNAEKTSLAVRKLVEDYEELYQKWREGTIEGDVAGAEYRKVANDIRRLTANVQAGSEEGIEYSRVIAEIRRQARLTEAAFKDAEAARNGDTDSIEDNTDALKQNAQANTQANAAAKRAQTEQDVVRARQRIGAGQANQTDYDLNDQIVDYNNYIRVLNRASTSQETNSEAAREYAREAQRAKNVLSELNFKFRDNQKAVRENGRALEGIIGGLDRLRRKFSQSGESVSALDNNLRGIAILAILGFFQQLITAAVGLAGALVAVAGSAAQAGAALGGALSAGVAQALPVIGILIASLARLKDVIDVVKQTELVREQTATRSAGAQKRQADAADAIANAQEGVTDALEGVQDAERGVEDARRRVADSQRGLTEAQKGVVAAQKEVLEAQQDVNDARKQAVRDIRDVMQAERDAELARQGAVRSQAEAAERLRIAVDTGDVEGLAEAEAGVLEADQGLNAANFAASDARREANQARRTGVEGTDVVKGAKDSLASAREAVVNAQAGVEDAQRGVSDALRGVADAERGVVKAQRAVVKAQEGVEDARKAANDAATDEFAAAAKLADMLAQLSPAERKLYEAIRRLRDQYKESFRPITDIFTRDLTSGVNDLTKLLKNPALLASISSLATAMTTQMARFRRNLFSSRVVEQFQRIMGQAEKTLVPLTSIAIDLTNAFLNIAEAAGPGLLIILGYFEGLGQRILGLSQDEGLAAFFIEAAGHTVRWFEALEAVVLLFAALASAGSDTGLDAIQDFTAKVTEWTEYIRNNRGEVEGFFETSRFILDQILRVAGALIKGIADVFNPDLIEQFATFLTDSVIPGLVYIIKLVGQATAIILTLINTIPGGNMFAAALIGLLLFTKVLNGTVGLYQQFIIGIAKAARALNTASFNAFNTGLNKVAGGFGAVATKLGDVLKKVPLLSKLGDVFTKLGDKLKGVSGNVDRFKDKIDDAAKPPADGAGAAGAAGGAPNKKRYYGADGEPLTPGTPAYIAAKRADDAKAAGGTGDPEGPKTKAQFDADEKAKADARKRQRRSRAFKGAGVLGLVGAGAAAQATGGQEELSNATGSFGSRAGLGADQATRVFTSALSLDFKGVGGALKGLFNDGRDLEKFSKNADRDLKRLFAEKNVKGLEELGKKAKELGEKYPSYAEGLGKFADTVSRNIDGLKERTAFLGDFDYAKHIQSENDKIIASFALVDDATKKMAGNYSVLLKKTTVSISDIRKVTGFNVNKINEKLGKGTKEGKAALAATFGEAADAVREAMKDKRISVSDGIREINRLMAQSLRQYGFTEKQIDNFNRARNAKPGSSESKINVFGGIEEGEAGRAVGGWIGNKGERGQDKGAYRLGRGEAVLNYAHIPDVNAGLRKIGYNDGLDGLFRQRKAQHAGSPGNGTSITNEGFAQGGYVQGAKPPGGKKIRGLASELFGRGFSVTSGGEARGTGTYHDQQQAIDFGDSVNNMAALWRILHPQRSKFAELFGPDALPGAPAYFFGKAGAAVPGHNDHIHVALLESGKVPGLGNGANSGGEPGGLPALVFKALKRVTAKGNKRGTLGALGQAAVDRVRTGANRRLASQVRAENQKRSAAGGSDSNADVSSDGGVARTILRVWRSRGMPFKALLSAFETGIVESGMRNLSGGDQDSQGWRQERTSLYKNPQNVVASANRFFNEWRQFDDNGESAGDVAAQVQRPRADLRGRYNQERGAALRLLRSIGVKIPRSLSFDVGGEIPGNEGDPIPILAHGKEWVVNKRQQAKLALLSGLSREGLRSTLGFGGSNNGAAAGTEVKATTIGDSERKLAFNFSSQFETNRLKRIRRGIFELPFLPLREWEDILRESKRAMTALNRSGRSVKQKIISLNAEIRATRLDTSDKEDKQIADLRKGGTTADERKKILAIRKETTKEEDKEIAKLQEQRKLLTANTAAGRAARRGITSAQRIAGVDGIIREGGLIDKLAEGRGRQVAKRARAAIFNQFSKVIRGKDFEVQSTGTATERADKQLESAKATLSEGAAQEELVDQTKKVVTDRLKALKKGGIKPAEAKEARALETRLSRLREQQNEIRDANASALQAVFDAQVARQQAVIDDINNDAAKATGKNELARRVAGAIGNKGAIAAINKVQSDILESQANRLSEQIGKARRQGNNDLADQLQAQVDDLRVQIFELAQQALRDALETINEKAGKRLAQADRFDRAISAFGVGEGGVALRGGEVQTRDSTFGVRDSALRTQRAELEELLNRSAAAGNVGLVQEITEQLTDLDISIQENVVSRIRGAIDEINNRTGRRLSRIDLFSRAQDALGAVGLDQAVNIGGELMTRRGQFAARGAALGSQRDDLQSVLRRVMTENPQNVQLIQDLTDQLAELDVTIQENSKALFETRVNDTNTRAQRGSGTLDLRRRVEEAMARANGTEVNNGRLLELERARTVILQTQRGELQGLLNEAISSGNQQAIMDLTDQLLENEAAVYDNTSAINELNGMTQQPQTFQSSAWTMFREAIFNGMGGVLPQYQIGSAATGGIITRSGLLNVHEGEPIIPAAIARADFSNMGSGGDTFNFEVNEAGGEIDLTRLAATVAFAKKTANR